MTTSTFNMTPVQSTLASEVGYNLHTSTLRIRFHNGATYDYAGVSSDLASGLMGNESIGRSYNCQIRNQYPCTRIS